MAVIHAHTLDVLDSIGVADSLATQGIKLSTFTIRDRDFPFDTLASKHAYLLMLPQDATEKTLADRLAALGGTGSDRMPTSRRWQTKSQLRCRFAGPTSLIVDRSTAYSLVEVGDGMVVFTAVR